MNPGQSQQYSERFFMFCFLASATKNGPPVDDEEWPVRELPGILLT
jgi:hypothetical protein